MTVTRREFMVGVAGLGFSLLLDGCETARPRGGASLAEAPTGGARSINAWASLATDGTVYIANPAVEMGQGSQTAVPRIIAEEMDADWDRVVIVPAPRATRSTATRDFRGLMYTAGSATITGYWDVARVYGAQVRRVLMQNAAARVERAARRALHRAGHRAAREERPAHELRRGRGARRAARQPRRKSSRAS
jgi:isoquinoline 1-oxidoreductase beta subunit